MAAISFFRGERHDKSQGRGEPLPLPAARKPGQAAPAGERRRRASGAAARALSGVSHAATTLSALDLSATVQGTVLGAYSFRQYKSEPGDDPVAKVDVLVPDAKDEAAKHALKGATAIGEAVTTARDLINTPPNDLFPASFAERAAELEREAVRQSDRAARPLG